MQIATVIGHATATIKHPSLTGLRLMLVQPLNASRTPEADPLLVVDKLGCGTGHTVVIDQDGRSARALIGNEKTPLRWYVIGIVDD